MPILLILLLIPLLIICGFLKALSGIIDEIRHRVPRGGNQRAVQRSGRGQENSRLSGRAFDKYGEIADEPRTPGFDQHGEIEE